MSWTSPIRRAAFLGAALVLALALRGDTDTTAPALASAQQVLAFVNQSIDWQRGIAGLGQIVNNPAEVLYFNEARQTGREALRLSFDFGRGYAQFLAQTAPAPAPASNATNSTSSSMGQMAAAAANEARERQAQLTTLERKLPTTRGAARLQLQDQIDAMRSEIELEQTRAETLRSLLEFSGGTGPSGLLAQINELQQSVPALETGNNTEASAPGTSSDATTADRTTPTGIIAVSEDLIRLGRQAKILKAAQSSTADLSKSAAAIRAPLVSQLTSIVKEGDKAVEAAGGDYAARKQQLDALTRRYKQLSAAVLPLGKQSILLKTFQSNLKRWHAIVTGQYQTEVKTLLVHLIVLALVLFVVFAFSEIWRRAIVRYVRDLRRRYQLLLIRRILLWIAIAIACAFTLASQVGSLATYIGLVTAGLAVALQNLILAIAGYFFLIGKYGVRAGDRVQIGGVAGVVADIGLIRLHLIELGTPETGREPTGRMVVFSNAVVFQPGASFFRQLPGTSYTWHEVTLTLAPQADYQGAEKTLLGAVEAVYERYRERIERQHSAMQRDLGIDIAVPRPHSRLRLTTAGMEVVIRFPTEVANSAEMDDAVTRALVHAIEHSARLRFVGSGTPSIQPVADAAPPVPPAPQPKPA